jgi:hypothetical protein
MENYSDSFYVDRGIDAGVAEARGYRFWDEDSYNEIMEDMYGHLNRRGVMAFAKTVGRQGPGVVFPRHGPPEFPDITAGLRPEDPVKLAAPKRHIHAEDHFHTPIFAFLPAVVELAYCSPQRGRIKVFFEHTHTAQTEAEHLEVWHPSGPRDESHGHTFYVYEARKMRKHIEQTKNSDSHKGVNPPGVHSHQKRAKYLYTPSEKLQVEWPTEHEHVDLKGPLLQAHLEKFH